MSERPPELRYPDPPLGDCDLRLRPYREEDLLPLVEAAQDPQIPRFTGVPDDYGPKDSRAFLLSLEPERRGGRSLSLAIDSGGLVGSVGLAGFAWADGRVEIGYWLAAHARGRGLGTRAVRLLSCWAILELGMERVELHANPANLPSQRLAERAGFTREGLLRSLRPRKGVREDLFIYSLIRADLRPS